LKIAVRVLGIIFPRACGEIATENFIVSSSSQKLEVYTSLFLVSAAINVPECTASHHVDFILNYLQNRLYYAGFFES
jgi:hypothetical protein